MHTDLPDALAAALDRVLDGGVRSVFQPIVDLDSDCVVAYEALARGPEGPLERPDAMFAAARSAGRLAELDEACRAAAFRAAVAHGLLTPTTVFVNVEPDVLDSAPLADLLAIADTAPRELRVVLEVTERALAARPAELLRTVERVRRLGWGIALDDVGADPMSLSFMPLLRPDVVKLDLRLVQGRPGPAVAQVMNAVNAYAESTGALVLAEGIETAEHLATARSLGASLGQGWLFGRPEPAPALDRPCTELFLPSPEPVDVDEPGDGSPFGCLPEGTRLRSSPKSLLVELSKQLEREAVRVGQTCVVAATFQEARHVTPATERRYAELAAATGFVCAVGEGLDTEPLPGIRGATLAPADPVRDEWDVVVLGPHFSAALLARDLGSTGPDMDRQFEYALTYERTTVVRAARALLSRVAPRPAGALPAAPPRAVPAPPAEAPEPPLATSAPPPVPIPRPRAAVTDHRAHLESLGATDPVTGLPSRLRTEELLEIATWNARGGDDVLGVLTVDLDGIDALADRFGRAAADDLLRAAAQRLRGRLRHGDLAGRLGAGRFAAAVPCLASAAAARETSRIAGALADAMSAPFVVAGEQVVLGVRVGSALCPADADDVPGLLGAAATGTAVRR
ncbi:EAL domain-containing protein [Blastococcus goldschmidtiae]|uniref:EAL domain-containing protein n=1 Tax=Blastococcus goldschmidtiae TaxID=3075546 RepID=A0ABU2KBR2_9ACTN|nr:EAL domain-containing protein [Blastococcus sp. DSM 46792]MDT0277622.1 EAL domain-containing protein [Blastococcus sp. DSM 46792]